MFTYSGMESVRFHFDNIHGGFSTATGLLHLDETGLRLEYRLDIGGVGLKTGAKEIAIDFDEIQSIDFKRGWFRARAMIRPASLKVLERFPAANDDSVTLRFLRRDRSRAEYLISEATLRLSQRRLEALSAGREGED